MAVEPRLLVFDFGFLGAVSLGLNLGFSSVYHLVTGAAGEYVVEDRLNRDGEGHIWVRRGKEVRGLRGGVIIDA